MKKRRSRYQQGSVFLDRRRNIWYFRWYDDAGVRRTAKLGTASEIPTKAKALRMAEGLRITANAGSDNKPEVTFEGAARAYIGSDRIPQRTTTNKGYRNYLERYAIPQFGGVPLPEVKPKDVTRWFAGLPLAAKTKAHIKSVMRQVFEFAMLEELFERQRNPMDLVRVVGATSRGVEPQILTHEGWQ